MTDGKGVRMERERFYTEFTEFILGLKPNGSEQAVPLPTTHLWETGYLDSFAMLEVVVHLEGLVGCEIELGPDALPSFYTLERIYDTYFEERAE